MDCPNCGKEDSGDSPLCSSCGWVLCWRPLTHKAWGRMAKQLLLVALLFVGAVLPIRAYYRSTARVNPTLTSAGLATLRTSQAKFRMETVSIVTLGQIRGSPQATFIKIWSDSDTIAQFVRQSPILRNVPARVLGDGAKHKHDSPYWPAWFRPVAITKGCHYRLDSDSCGREINVFIDDESSVIFIIIDSSQIASL